MACFGSRAHLKVGGAFGGGGSNPEEVHGVGKHDP